MFATLHDYKMSYSLSRLGEKLGHWVKLQLSTWFISLLTKYETNRWIEHFQMSKDTFMDICNQMRPLISKHESRYRKAILVEICVSCAIYKLA